MKREKFMVRVTHMLMCEESCRIRTPRTTSSELWWRLSLISLESSQWGLFFYGDVCWCFTSSVALMTQLLFLSFNIFFLSCLLIFCTWFLHFFFRLGTKMSKVVVIFIIFNSSSIILIFWKTKILNNFIQNQALFKCQDFFDISRT